MNHKTLEQALQANFPTISKPRLVFLAILIQALFEAATVNLSLVSCYFNPKVDKKSNQRRWMC